MDEYVKKLIEVIKKEGIGFDGVLLAALSEAGASEAATLLKAFPHLWEEIQPGNEED